jgi:hypothetical protein
LSGRGEVGVAFVVHEFGFERAEKAFRDGAIVAVAAAAHARHQAVSGQRDRLLNLHLAGTIDVEVFVGKCTDLRDRLASIKLQLDVIDRSHDEIAELAVKALELSQTLREQWLTADYAAKRRILEIVLSNCSLDGVTLCPTIRKPFDVLAEGLLSEESGGGGNRTRVPK